MPPWRIMPCFLHPSPILPSSAMHCRIQWRIIPRRRAALSGNLFPSRNGEEGGFAANGPAVISFLRR